MLAIGLLPALPPRVRIVLPSYRRRASKPPPPTRSPAPRQAESVDTSTSHIGFRCVIREVDR
jgi:hypothetical protein